MKHPFFGSFLLLLAACSGSSSGSGAGGAASTLSFSTSASVAGPADAHCAGMTPTVVSEAACTQMVPSDENGGAGGDTGSAAGSAGSGGVPTNAQGDCESTDPDFGAIVYGSDGDDDDCKYHATWESTTVAENADVTFRVTLTDLTTMAPVTGAKTSIEPFFPCMPTHPPPAIDFQATSREPSPGTYEIGPIRFDQKGRWAVRFHFFEDCLDQPTSPHGHIAFYVDVP